MARHTDTSEDSAVPDVHPLSEAVRDGSCPACGAPLDSITDFYSGAADDIDNFDVARDRLVVLDGLPDRTREGYRAVYGDDPTEWPHDPDTTWVVTDTFGLGDADTDDDGIPTDPHDTVGAMVGEHSCPDCEFSARLA